MDENETAEECKPDNDGVDTYESDTPEYGIMDDEVSRAGSNHCVVPSIT